MELGKIITFYRKSQAMTQKQLAQGICSQGEISLIEKGQRIPSITVIHQISERLGVSLNAFDNLEHSSNLVSLNKIFSKLELFVNERHYYPMKELLTSDLLQQCITTTDKQTYYAYLGIFLNYQNKDYQKALETYRIALQESNPLSFKNILDIPKHKNLFSRTETLLLAGAASTLFLLKKYESAGTLYDLACKNVKHLKSQISVQILGTIFYNACKNYKELNNYEKAIQIGKTGISYEQSHKAVYRSAEIYFEMGEVMFRQSKIDFAARYYIKSICISFGTGDYHFLNLLIPELQRKDIESVNCFINQLNLSK